MRAKRILLMHISNVTGHHRASLAIEDALREVDQNVEVRNINAFNYTNSYLARYIYKLYILIIKAVPWLWDYLYDNEAVLKRIKKLRALIHRLSDKKIKKLFDEFTPDIVVCTQAFPCGMVADYKYRHNLNLPLVGVLTDYAPHVYWLNDYIDLYVVPDPKVGKKLLQKGVSGERQRTLGIPIDKKFGQQTNCEEVFRKLKLDPKLPVILIMGGSQGLGPIKKIIQTLDRLTQDIQLIVACGTNKRLYKWIRKNKPFLTKTICVVGYAENIDELMAISSLIVTKTGGLTSAEALAKSLPIVIINPLPGQESLNTKFLLKSGAALKVGNFLELRSLVERLLSDDSKLKQLRNKACSLAYPDSALKIAQTVLNMTDSQHTNNN
ncbi:MAG: glycosyltransferase [Omnitrophica bacterium]|nr:glycosyltransferase [Candidatus Omnitrophota bacterium]